MRNLIGLSFCFFGSTDGGCPPHEYSCVADNQRAAIINALHEYSCGGKARKKRIAQGEQKTTNRGQIFRYFVKAVYNQVSPDSKYFVVPQFVHFTLRKIS